VLLIDVLKHDMVMKFIPDIKKYRKDFFSTKLIDRTLPSIKVLELKN